jgi:hypothetical protein
MSEERSKSVPNDYETSLQSKSVLCHRKRICADSIDILLEDAMQRDFKNSFYPTWIQSDRFIFLLTEPAAQHTVKKCRAMYKINN